MLRNMLKSKIHGARVTAASVDYEGSITVDRGLLETAGILPYEEVHVLDLESGARLTTYALPGQAGEVCINGAAARLVKAGDQVIILTYASLTPAELEDYEPVVIRLDENNRPVAKTRAGAAVGRPESGLPQ